MIAGMNLMALALSVVGTQSVTWHRANGRTQNAQGQWMTSFDAPIIVDGSVQAVNRVRYQAMGLDLARRYSTFYGTAPIKGMERGQSPDLIDYNGRRHEVVNDQDWIPQAGWCGVLVVDTGPVP